MRDYKHEDTKIAKKHKRIHFCVPFVLFGYLRLKIKKEPEPKFRLLKLVAGLGFEPRTFRL